MKKTLAVLFDDTKKNIVFVAILCFVIIFSISLISTLFSLDTSYEKYDKTYKANVKTSRIISSKDSKFDLQSLSNELSLGILRNNVYMMSKDNSGSNASAIIVNNEVANNTTTIVKEGSWFSKDNGADYVEGLVKIEEKAKYELAKIYNFDLDLYSTTNIQPNINVKIIGYIDSDSYLLRRANQHSTYDSIFGALENEEFYINCNQIGEFMKSCELPLTDAMLFDKSALVNNSEIDKINIQYMNDKYELFQKYTTDARNQQSLLLLISCLIIVSGLACYMVLKYENDIRLNSVKFLCGQSVKSIFVVELLGSILYFLTPTIFMFFVFGLINLILDLFGKAIFVTFTNFIIAVAIIFMIYFIFAIIKIITTLFSNAMDNLRREE